MLKRPRSDENEGERVGFRNGMMGKKRREGVGGTGQRTALSRDAGLYNLLDFSAPSLESLAEISARFDDIASYLLSRVRLVVQMSDSPTSSPSSKDSIDAQSTVAEEYEILEIEFYLFKAGSHEDAFTHGNEEQRVPGQWYFHRAPRRTASISSRQPDSAGHSAAGGYRGGTRKGLDLTLGSLIPLDPPLTSRFFTEAAQSSSTSCKDIRGGVLLRSIRRSSDSRVISGPSLLVDELLQRTRSSNIAELVQTKWCGNISAFPLSPSSSPTAVQHVLLYFRNVECEGLGSSTDGVRIFKSPRIGLDLSNTSTQLTVTDARIVFLPRLYRYFVHPHLLTSNGRAQTFLGIYEHLSASGRYEKNERALVEEISRLSGMKSIAVVKYLETYRAGCASDNLKQFVGPGGKGTSASPASYLRMMGCIHRFMPSA